MQPTRREFIVTAGAIGAASLFSGPVALGSRLVRPARRAKGMKILFLGGTGMLGPHAVRMLVERGHEVTLFNRGNRDEMFPDLEFIEGNRIVDEGPGLKPLEEAVAGGRRWDAVIDTASVHTWVENSARVLKDAADHYTYISSLSVYADNSQTGLDETDAVATMPDDVAETITTPRYNMMYYGAVKARSEAAAEKHFPGKTMVHRPGLLVGPRDFTHRFTYWPARVREGGEVLAPGARDHPLQFIDVRDLAAFMVHAIEQQHTGIYNVNGPIGAGMTTGKMLDTCKKVTGSDATFTWVDGDFLGENGVAPWAQMPVWIPPAEGSAGFHTRSLEKAAKAGLKTRPLDETVRDTLAWFDDEYLDRWKETMVERGMEDPEFTFGGQLPGISREREAELLAAWKEQADD
ncbi:MAG: NAD-dependent epimerase/dehydratase family protein [bacterium]|nr:NAD-dependent epimerase/dehydratase family protein [bacterium]